jgi:L,D-transpeptidase-like protein
MSRIALLIVSLSLLSPLPGIFSAAAQAGTPEATTAGAVGFIPSAQPVTSRSGTGAIAELTPLAPSDGILVRTPGLALYDSTTDASILDPQSWALMAYKSRHELILYYKGRLFKIYHAVFGRSHELGTKQWAGDRRTPEGLYVIVKKYPSTRWKWFLRFNYPNRVDRYRYEAMRDEGLVPVAEGRPLPPGSAIGIHGTDQAILNRSNIDWTTGCISVDNDAVFELDRLLPIGTIVVIKP